MGYHFGNALVISYSSAEKRHGVVMLCPLAVGNRTRCFKWLYLAVNWLQEG